jgi:predicted nucleic acid-binding protein
MTIHIDTSVLVAAMVTSEDFHAECFRLVMHPEDSQTIGMYSHGLTETFSTLTGGRRRVQLPADVVADMLQQDYLPHLVPASLEPAEILQAMCEARSRGVRGGGIFDYLHLVAARKAKAARLYTLNLSNFRAFHRPGDPEIAHPASV